MKKNRTRGTEDSWKNSRRRVGRSEEDRDSDVTSFFAIFGSEADARFLLPCLVISKYEYTNEKVCRCQLDLDKGAPGSERRLA